MKKRFTKIMAEVERKCDSLMAARPFKCAAAPKCLEGRPGIYLFSERGHPLYVGRTRNLRNRLASHCHRSHYTATFAFLLARDKTRLRRASYQASGSRADLLKNNAEFAAAFDAARERIAEMDVRVVEEADPVRQAVLEIYVAVVSGARYNDFQTH